MKLSEDLLSSMVLELKGSYKIQYHAVSFCQIHGGEEGSCCRDMSAHAAAVAAAELTDGTPCVIAFAAAPELHEHACGAH